MRALLSRLVSVRQSRSVFDLADAQLAARGLVRDGLIRSQLAGIAHG